MKEKKREKERKEKRSNVGLLIKGKIKVNNYEKGLYGVKIWIKNCYYSLEF